MEAGAEVGVGAAIGLRAKLRESSFVGARCGIAHGVRVGRNVSIGPHSYVDSAAVIQDDIKLPARSTIASRTIVDKRPSKQSVAKAWN
jgi:UDP-3-O-[3-hydroxymyristoyl] glucosamine N-acyltransferase